LGRVDRSQLFLAAVGLLACKLFFGALETAKIPVLVDGLEGAFASRLLRIRPLVLFSRTSGSRRGCDGR